MLNKQAKASLAEKTGTDMNKPQETNIFLDLDGVIADFDAHARTQGKMKPGGKLDYDAMDLAWWETMPAFEGARHFYDELRKIGNVRS